MLGTLEMAKTLYVIQYPVLKSGQGPELSGEVGEAYYRIGAPWSNIVPMVHKVSATFCCNSEQVNLQISFWMSSSYRLFS